MHKYYELNAEEEKLLADFESSKLKKTSATKKDLARYRGYVKTSLNQTRNINIRLPERDLQKLKTKAAQKGLPYQTLISSVLRQYTSR